MSPFAPLPDAPYYAVIFSNTRNDGDHGYDDMALHMVERAAEQDGYIGVESTRDAHGFGITVSYWRDEAALLNWKAQSEHILAQKLGKTRWYDHYRLRVAKVERSYSGPEGR
ncbi:MAG: antibiotic biosynthesis monooxygenase family protein [Halocynthiibacter sp.]